MRGIEVPIVVLFSSAIEGPQVEKVLSRCKSKLIIICNEMHANILVVESQCSFAQNIPVFGKCNFKLNLSFI
jgi:hypothetical protein